MPVHRARADGSPTTPKYVRLGGGGWIRTSVGVSQQIYSLPPLATRAPLRGEPQSIAAWIDDSPRQCLPLVVLSLRPAGAPAIGRALRRALRARRVVRRARRAHSPRSRPTARRCRAPGTGSTARGATRDA